MASIVLALDRGQFRSDRIRTGRLTVRLEHQDDKQQLLALDSGHTQLYTWVSTLPKAACTSPSNGFLRGS
ncbi:hypothetical protein [Stenomitos frigidus]|uniref:hypothetical protein n=1 Tax=Stenomitos frigidus TaxID=1886765 RepID=UPI0011B1FCF2|nr:hypothetical protein [Stenomitos frigidus]